VEHLILISPALFGRGQLLLLYCTATVMFLITILICAEIGDCMIHERDCLFIPGESRNLVAEILTDGMDNSMYLLLLILLILFVQVYAGICD